MQNVFEEVKEEEPINAEIFLTDDNDIFDSEEISNAESEFIIETVHPEEKKLRRKNKCQFLTMNGEKMRALKIV